MGRQKQKAGVPPAQAPVKKLSNHLKNKLNPQVQKLLNKCTCTVDPKTEFDNYVEIYNILQEIREIEKDHVVPFPAREENFSAFLTWCSMNGAEFDAISVKKIDHGNFATFAEVDLKENDKFLSIPKALIMSVENAKSSKFGPLISEDPILSAMPNVALSLFLIMEYLNKESFWQPYLSILPQCYDTILYFTVEDLQELQRSPSLSQALNTCRSVARQYAYFYQLFQNNAYASDLEIGSFFTYDLYRWAVSTVMTRQNSIPTSDGSSVTAALVPLWDMCNHANGKLTTDFNPEENRLISFCMQDFTKGDEVCIFYGPRSNSEFFIHNGFVPLDNENDWFLLQLNISKNDPLFADKKNLCLKSGIPLNGKFKLTRIPGIEPELEKFLKINVLKAEEISKILEDESFLEEYLELNAEIKCRALNFLKDRAALLLKCYKTTLEEDEKLLKNMRNSCHQMAIQLRVCEKQLLNQCLNYCSECLAQLTK